MKSHPIGEIFRRHQFSLDIKIADRIFPKLVALDYDHHNSYKNHVVQ